ncbi:MAG: glycoside hydrolase family 16 protein [Actinomycetota bacterium]|nr:glycoside hydrolase family 16 protein [Actinomycetota bacterium]
MAELPKSSAVLQVLFVAVFGAVLVALSVGNAEAGGTGFQDDFDSFESTRWTKSDHVLGRTDLDPANVSVGSGYARLKIPARTTGGAEIASVEPYGYGTYKARIKTANAPSSITGFFLYRSPDYEAEIDIEIYNDGSGKVDFVTYADGRRTHVATKKLGFDPSAAFHVYRFDYKPGAVKFYVDGKLMQVWENSLPRDSMKLLVDTWFPRWLAGTAPRLDRYTRVDWIRYRQV